MTVQDVREQSKAVTHDAVDTEAEEMVDCRFVVDRPHVNWYARPMRGGNEALRDNRDRSPVRRDLQAIGAETRNPARRGGEAGERDPAWSHRCARLATTERADPAQAAV